ncbi:MAG TPA: sigma-70 family RNA polymerase sigma factor [Gaiellaceae bacterium]|nr:sigma-70 family RNA polymerase sigma factor [Gaiellaceae bacterium]
MAAVPEVGRAAGIEPGGVAPGSAPEATATQELYERYAGQVFGFCLHRLGSREEAEDAVQQTFLNAFRGFQRGVVPDAEAAWLFKIAENVCLTRRRSSWRRGRVESPGDLQALQDLVAAPQRLGTDELIQLQDALASMPPSQRKAILLREWQGLSYREIAAELELSDAAVETLIFRARRSLARGLERPPERQGVLARLRHGLDLGAFAAAAKGLLAGGAAVKAVATTAAAVTVAGAVVAATRVPRGEEAPRASLRLVRDAPADARAPAAASRPVAPAAVAPVAVAPRTTSVPALATPKGSAPVVAERRPPPAGSADPATDEPGTAGDASRSSSPARPSPAGEARTSKPGPKAAAKAKRPSRRATTPASAHARKPGEHGQATAPGKSKSVAEAGRLSAKPAVAEPAPAEPPAEAKQDDAKQAGKEDKQAEVDAAAAPAAEGDAAGNGADKVKDKSP